MKLRKLLFFVATFLAVNTGLIAQGSVSGTYTFDIPTSFPSYDASCTGPSTILSVTLPPGDNYNVTSIDIVYDMTATAAGGGFMSQQRSQIYCQNTNVKEAVINGTGASAGTLTYNRTGVNIANVSFPGETTINFEMRAWRTHSGITAGCNTSTNMVDASSWTITVHYSAEVVNPKVGIEQASPKATLDVNGEIKLGSSTNSPEAGMVRWNTDTQDFEGYNGTAWVSFTQKKSNNWVTTTTSESSSVNPSDGAAEDNFGVSVSISGDYAIVGSYGNNNNKGKAYIFKRSGVNWNQQYILVASDGVGGDFFGYSVSIYGDYAVVGAFSHDTGGNNNQGKAYVFKRTGVTWAEQDILEASDGAIADNFGRSVSIYGDYAIVGAYLHDIGGNNNQGKAYVFKRLGAIWTEQDVLVASDGAEFDIFGRRVSIYGDYAIVGSYLHNVGGNLNEGKAYIFKRSGVTWSQHAILVASDGAENDNFGNSVRIYGDYVIVGSYHHDTGGNLDEGKAYIFKRSGAIWSEQAILVASDGAVGDNFGYSVSIYGDYAIVGAINHDIGGNSNQGKAYIFERSGTTWSEQAILVASDGAVNDNFGRSVSIYGDHVIVGALYHDTGGNSNQGKAYFFKK